MKISLYEQTITYACEIPYYEIQRASLKIARRARTCKVNNNIVIITWKLLQAIWWFYVIYSIKTQR